MKGMGSPSTGLVHAGCSADTSLRYSGLDICVYSFFQRHRLHFFLAIAHRHGTFDATIILGICEAPDLPPHL